MSRNPHVDERLLLGQLGEHLGGKVGAAVGNQKLKVGRQQGSQRFDDHGSGHLGACDKERQCNALATTVIGDDQDGNPGADGRTLRQVFTEPLPLRPPRPIFAPPARQDHAALDAAHAPAELVGRLGQHGAASCGAALGRALLGTVMLAAGCLPRGIFPLALLAPRAVQRLPGGAGAAGHADQGLQLRWMDQVGSLEAQTHVRLRRRPASPPGRSTADRRRHDLDRKVQRSRRARVPPPADLTSR